MHKDFDQIKIEFNQIASAHYFSLYKEFENSVRRINRQKDENVFQQLRGKYVKRLREHLMNLALELLDKHQLQKNISQLNKSLTDEIAYYVNEFIQKSKSF